MPNLVQILWYFFKDDSCSCRSYSVLLLSIQSGQMSLRILLNMSYVRKLRRLCLQFLLTIYHLNCLYMLYFVRSWRSPCCVHSQIVKILYLSFSLLFCTCHSFLHFGQLSNSASHWAMLLFIFPNLSTTGSKFIF